MAITETAVNTTAGSSAPIDVVDDGTNNTMAITPYYETSGAALSRVGETAPLPTTLSYLEKAEDAAHNSGDKGIMPLSVRQDTAAALAGTDADYQPLITDGNGRLHVNIGELFGVTTMGQKSMGNSLSVALSTNHSTVPVDIQTTGQAVMASSVPVVIASDQSGLTVSSLPQVQNEAGYSGQWHNPIKVSGSTIGASAATYASGDVIGGLVTLSNAVFENDGTIKIDSITLQDEATQDVGLKLVFFDSNPNSSTITDNVAFDIAFADAEKHIGTVSIGAGSSNWDNWTITSVATLTNVGLRLSAGGGSKSLYMVVVSQGTPTFTANCLSINIDAYRP